MLLILHFFCLHCLIGWAQEKDAMIMVRNNDFLKRMLSTKEHFYTMMCNPNQFLTTDIPILKNRYQYIIKTPKNLYVQAWGSGYLFKMTSQNDSLLEFRRIDITENINYNQGAYHFSIDEDIYNFGGYGFWKTNGHLRKYNFHLNEWGIYQTSDEVIPQLGPINPTWLDPKSKKLYLPFESQLNAGLLDKTFLNGKINNTSRILDLKTGIWDKTGSITKQCLEILKTGTLKFNCERGLLIIWNDELYLIDYLNNFLFKSEDKSAAQYVLQLDNSYLAYHHNNFLYRLNLHANKTDSIPLNLNSFIKTDIKIVENNNLRYLGYATLLIFISVGTYFFSKKTKRKPKAIKADLFEKKPLNISFNDVEKALITLLIKNSDNSQPTTVDEVNYIAGVKDKSIGLQKKVRNDLLNSINEKYKILIQKNENFIQRKRSVEDKRYFEYYITDDDINTFRNSFNNQ